MRLNSYKTSKVFCINICCFSIRFYFFCTTVAQSTKFLISTPTKPKRSLCNSSNDQYQGNGFAADVLLGPKSRTNRSHRKRSYSISNIGNMMRCDYLSCVPVGPLAGELWHFEYFPTTTVRHFEV